MTERVEQQIRIRFCVKLEHPPWKLFRSFRRLQLGATGDWQLHWNNVPAHASHLMQSFLAKQQITQVTQPPYSQGLVPCDFWLFPKLKPSLKGKRFQTIYKIQANTVGQLMCDAPRYLLWRELRFPCPTYKFLVTSSIIFILHGWIPLDRPYVCISHTHINTYTYIYIVFPEGIQPCNMKNRDIYWRRYKIQEPLYTG